MIEQSTGIAFMTVSKTVEYLTKAYTSLIINDYQLNSFPSVMLWGSPGVGKSQGIKQIAANIYERTGKQVVITDVRLLLFNPVDLRGIPTTNADKTLAIWLKPKIFQMDESKVAIHILFLDEFSAAPQSVQAASYQITLDRMVGEHKLPNNCIVIAAGNRVTDRSVAYHMPKALANRLCHIEITTDINSWHQWAVSVGINPIVLGFLDYNPSMLMNFDASSEDLSFPTPRSWEMVSNILNYVSDNLLEVFPLIAGCIGNNAAYELRSWCEIYTKTPSFRDIASGIQTGIPKRAEILYAVASQIAVEASKLQSVEEINNVIAFSSKLPIEFRDNIFSDLLSVDELHAHLKKNNTFNDWFMRSGLDWEDYII